jgi:hypothetical protein
VADLIGRGGWLTLARLTVQALEDEDRLLLAALDDDGRALHAETCAKLWQVGGRVAGAVEPPAECAEALRRQVEHLAGIRIKEIGERNNRFFEREMDKLDRWADDRKNSLELELKDLKGQINQVDRQARLAADLQGKLTFQRQKADLERQRKERQRKLYDAEDEIEARKEQLLAEVEQRLRQTVTTKELFTIRWEVV